MRCALAWRVHVHGYLSLWSVVGPTRVCGENQPVATVATHESYQFVDFSLFVVDDGSPFVR